MTDASIKAWESELKSLMDTIHSHPSRDLTHERERVAVLEKLIVDYQRNNPA